MRDNYDGYLIFETCKETNYSCLFYFLERMRNRTIKTQSYQQERTQWKSVLKSGYILTVRCTVFCNVHNVHLKRCWLDASHRGAWVQASEYVVYT